MKKYISIAVFTLCISCLNAGAQQNFRSGYFLDGYTYAFKLNPAFKGERGFFSMPVLGNLTMGVETNLGISTFLYPLEGSNKLTTFMSPTVSDDVFMKALRKNNNFNTNLNLSMMAFGFKTGKAYHTVDLSFKTDVGVNMPKDLFRFMKVGAADNNPVYDLSNLGARADMRMEIAYGYSRDITDWLRVGARLKLLVGLARADMKIASMDVEMSGNKWAITGNGSLTTCLPVGMGFMTMGEAGTATDPSQNNRLDLTAFKTPSDLSGYMKMLKSPSYGGALDIGISADFLKYFTASFSLLDIGMMQWRNMTVANTPDLAWTFPGFTIASGENGEAPSMDDQLKQLGDELLSAMYFEASDYEAKKTKWLAMTAHLGIEARCPGYERLTLGLLGTQRIDGAYSWTEGRFSLNWALLRWIGLTANYAISNFGHSFGGALNIHFPGITLYAGLDSFKPLLNVTPDFLPIDAMNTNVAIGLNFSFGKYDGKYPRKAKAKKEKKKKDKEEEFLL